MFTTTISSRHRRGAGALLILIWTTTLTLLPAAVEPKSIRPFSCDQSNPSTKSLPFCNLKLPIGIRARDLVSRLTLDEKVAQLVITAVAVPRLGIPGYEWWSEALHGVAEVGGGEVPQGIRFNGTVHSATSFPQVILSAATFDRRLWYRIGQGISRLFSSRTLHSCAISSSSLITVMSSLNLHTFALFNLIAWLSALAESTQTPFACGPLPKPYPFCELTLPIAQRARDLVSRLTLDEKAAQLVNSASAVPRLGVPAYQWWSEALHGVSRHGKGVSFGGAVPSATMFPQVILAASSFDAFLWFRIARAIGKEARGVYNEGQAKGMTFWAPNINIFRDPRWGRGQETPGEDPLMTAKYAVSYVRGIQGHSFQDDGADDGDHLQASACCKHFTAYDLDNWNGVNRFTFNAIVSKQDMADTYQPPFQSCVEKGRASGIMCAYNRVNGVPNCADYNLLTKLARGQWGFQGYITSDCDAVSIMHDDQGYAKSPEDAVADVLKAGMDVNCGSYLKNHTKSAVEQKKLPISEIDRALHNLFSVRMRLGLFNGDPSRLLYGNIGANQVCTKEHQDLALEAARDGIVLLKNSNGLLPLSKTKTMSLAVLGPNADAPKTLLGNYEGPPCNSISPLQSLKGYVKSTVYHPGCDFVNCSDPDIAGAIEIARKADYVVLVMGLDQTQEREERDRDDLVLPGKQQSLIQSVAKAAKHPVVLVLLCGGPVDVSFAKKDPKIGSILWAGYPGEAGGIALAEIIFGDHNPGGRLPLTWYPKDFVRVAMTDMRMRPDPSSGYPGRTYRFYRGRKVFEFGHGISYTHYSYKFVSVTQSKLYLNRMSPHDSDPSTRYLSVSDMGTELCEKARFSALVGVENRGAMEGKHPVLLFVREGTPRKGKAIKQLVGFESVRLKAGERAEIEFELNPCEHLSRANEDGLMVIEEGPRFLMVGDEEWPLTIEA